MRYFVCITFLVLLSCHKDDPPEAPLSAGDYSNGLVVLNEGLFQQNNSSLCYYSLDENQLYTQAFYSVNGRGLGDTANDFEKYTLGGTEYIIIAVDISSQIEIVNANTLESVAQIPLFDGSSAREPRRIVVNGFAAYVCSFDGTVSVIDLTTYEIVKTIQVGANPDGMIQVGNELFVSNSGGLNFPVYDSTLMVIDLTSREVIDTIQTRINCTGMLSDSQNEIYLLSNGNYSDVNPALVRMDASSHLVLSVIDLPVSSFAQLGDWMYFFDYTSDSVKRFDMLTDTVDTGFIMDLSSYQNFSGIQFLEELNTLFCFDANGYVNSSIIRAYGPAGNFKYEFTAELNTKKLIYND